MGPSERVIQETILALCLKRGAGKTICPSEVARALEKDEKAWRDLMPHVRDAAQHLALEGQIAIFRKGEPLHDHNVSGLIRLGIIR